MSGNGKTFEQIGRPPRDQFTGRNVPAPDRSWAVPGTVVRPGPMTKEEK